MVKNLPAMQKTWVQSLGSVPGLESFPGEGNGNPLQKSCLKSPRDRGAWWATIHGVAKSQTQLSDLFFCFTQLTPFKHAHILFLDFQPLLQLFVIIIFLSHSWSWSRLLKIETTRTYSSFSISLGEN